MAAFSTFKIGKHQMDTFKQYCKEHQDEIYKKISQTMMEEEFNKMADPTVSDKEAQEAAYKIVSAVEEATKPTDLLSMYLVQFFCESTKENIFNN